MADGAGPTVPPGAGAVAAPEAAGVLGLTGALWLVLVLAALPAIILSVAVGRGWRADRPLTTIGAVLASVVALLVGWYGVNSAFSSASDPYVYQEAIAGAESVGQPGLLSNGNEVRNIFAFDANGKPLNGVRLYDQNMNRLEVGNPSNGTHATIQDPSGQERKLFPYRDANGNDIWNTFPLYTSGPFEAPYGTDENGNPLTEFGQVGTQTLTPSLPTPPVVAVIPVQPRSSTPDRAGLRGRRFRSRRPALPGLPRCRR